MSAIASDSDAVRSDHRALALLFAFVAALCVYAQLRGQTASWDLRNYHLYGPWAWLNGRLDRDIAPAHLQSYFNPLLYVPIYAAAVTFSARALTFGLALLQALNVVPLFLIARRILPARVQGGGPWVAATVGIVGASGATQLGELGATQGDNLVSLLLLCGLAMLAAPAPRSRTLMLGGLLLGAAGGLKLTYAPWTAAAVLAAPLLAEPRRGLAFASRTGVAAAVGFALCAGPWMIELWQRFANPVFPMFGSIFHGPLQPPFDTRDPRFLPRGAMEAVFYPLRWSVHPRFVSELWFRDWRVPFWFLALVALPWWRRAARAENDPRGGSFLIAVSLIGYVAWLALFGIYRYLEPLEMLAPTLVVLAVARAFPTLDARRAARYVAPLLILCVLTTRAADWGHVPFRERLLESNAPRLSNADLVVLTGHVPTAFLALELGADAAYVRIHGNFVGGDLAPYGLDRAIAERLDAHDGRLWALIQGPPAAERGRELARFGLAFAEGGCRRIDTTLLGPDEFPARLCAVMRERSAQEALGELVASWRARCEGVETGDARTLRTCAVVRTLR